MLNTEITQTRPVVAPRDAYLKLLDTNGLAFLAELRSNKEFFARTFAESAESLEAYAAVSEWDGTATECAERLSSALPTMPARLKQQAYAHLGRLLVLSGSRERASVALAEAESLSESPVDAQRIARDRALLGMTERRWSEAIQELALLEKVSAQSGNQLFGLEAMTYRAVALVGNGESADAIDMLLAHEASMPKGGMLELRATWILARAYIDRVELDHASELLDRIRPFATPAMFETQARFLHAESEVALWRLDFDAARASLETLRNAAIERSLPIYEGHANYALSLLEFDAERYSESETAASAAAAIGARLGHTPMVGAAALVRVASLAARGNLNEARKAYRAIRRPHIEGIDAAYYDGMSALAEVLLAHLVASEDEAQAFDALAKDRIATLVKRNPQGVRNIDINFHLHMMARRLQRFAPLRGLETPLLQRIQPIGVDSEGRYIEFSNGERVSIEQRPVLRRLLECLAREMKTQPRVPIQPNDLIAATWPNDRAHDASLRVRLRVAIATLRQLGLDEALHTKHGGYYLSL